MNHIHYGNVNKRVRALKGGFIEEAAIKNTKAGFEAADYQITEKGYLSLAFSTVSLEDLLQQVNRTEALSILAVLAQLRSDNV